MRVSLDVFKYKILPFINSNFGSISVLSKDINNFFIKNINNYFEKIGIYRIYQVGNDLKFLDFYNPNFTLIKFNVDEKNFSCENYELSDTYKIENYYFILTPNLKDIIHIGTEFTREYPSKFNDSGGGGWDYEECEDFTGYPYKVNDIDILHKLFYLGLENKISKRNDGYKCSWIQPTIPEDMKDIDFRKIIISNIPKLIYKKKHYPIVENKKKSMCSSLYYNRFYKIKELIKYINGSIINVKKLNLSKDILEKLLDIRKELPEEYYLDDCNIIYKKYYNPSTEKNERHIHCIQPQVPDDEIDYDLYFDF
jgi:hypothetical protein